MNQKNHTVLEVCVDSYASAMAAVRGGADRLELCSALALGGLTPWTELLAQIRAVSDITIRCLMRPRAGDFLYSQEEIDLLCAQIKARAASRRRAGYPFHRAPLRSSGRRRADAAPCHRRKPRPSPDVPRRRSAGHRHRTDQRCRGKLSGGTGDHREAACASG